MRAATGVSLLGLLFSCGDKSRATRGARAWLFVILSPRFAVLSFLCAVKFSEQARRGDDAGRAARSTRHKKSYSVAGLA